MSLSAGVDSNEYTGNNTLDTYDYDFKIFEDSELEVIEYDEDGVADPLVLTTDYTVTGAGESAGGSIQLVAGNLASNHVLVIRRKLPFSQETSLRNQTNYYPENIEDEFDRAIMRDKQQQFEIDRSVRLPNNLTSSDFDPKLPTDLAGVAGAVPITNATGDGWADAADWITADEISTAQSYAVAAAASATAAATAETNAETAETNAETAQAAAEAAQAAAEAAQAAAEAAFLSGGPFVIADNQAVAADVTNMTADAAVVSSVIFWAEYTRSTTIMGIVTLALVRKNGTWVLHEGSDLGDGHGITFSVTETGGVAQVQYTSDSSGAGTLKWKGTSHAV